MDCCRFAFGFGRRRDDAPRSQSGDIGWHRPASGNDAFEDYRAETLRRLDQEQAEFREFLDRLRLAKDQEEFGAFLQERCGRPHRSPAPPQSATSQQPGDSNRSRLQRSQGD